MVGQWCSSCKSLFVQVRRTRWSFYDKNIILLNHMGWESTRVFLFRLLRFRSSMKAKLFFVRVSFSCQERYNMSTLQDKMNENGIRWLKTKIAETLQWNANQFNLCLVTVNVQWTLSAKLCIFNLSSMIVSKEHKLLTSYWRSITWMWFGRWFISLGDISTIIRRNSPIVVMR